MDLVASSLEALKNKNGIKAIAILTSGGDAPGMNAAIRAVTRSALSRDIKVYAIRDGYKGLWKGWFEEYTAGSVGDILHRGGTVLRTARLPEYATDRTIRDRCYQNLSERGVDALVVLGGDGSFQGANLLSKENPKLRVVCIPCTIDNDLGYTDFTIGFDTACNTSVDMINNLRDTMAALGRISVVEVMGRNCGDIAIYAGIAGGAEAIVIPEIDRDYDEWIEYIIEKLMLARKRDKEYGIIVMAEGMHMRGKDSEFFTAEYISEKINNYRTNGGAPYAPFESRSVVFAHVQRGGPPTVSDRVLASTLGYHAVKVLLDGENRRCVGTRQGQLYDEAIEVAIGIHRVPKHNLIDIADVLAR